MPPLGPPSIDARLWEALQRRGIQELTEIQKLALPVVPSGEDVLLVSPTGTGKTEAALLPLLSRRLLLPSPAISLLYVTPLRALNRDLEHRLVSLVTEVGLTAAVRHGDTPPAQRTRQSRNPPDLLLTTPETLQLLLVGTRLRESLRGVRSVIVDEVHELAPSDRGAQLAVSLDRLDAWVGHPIQRIGLSATIGNPEEVARFLAPEPRIIEVRKARQPRELIVTARLPEAGLPPLDAHLVSELKAEPVLLDALRSVESLVRQHRTTLVFVNTRPTAEGLAARLRRLAPDLATAVHHGSLSREVREEAEKEFRAGRLRCLVATSSLELGIDIGSVDLVIQFGSPHQAGRLVQRVGRSGHRLEQEIRGTVLALDEEDLEEAAVLARRARDGEIEPTRWRTRNLLAVAQQTVAALRADKRVSTPELGRLLRRSAATSDLSDSDWEGLVDYLVQLGLARRVGTELAPGRGTLERFYSTLSLIPDARIYRLRDIASRRVIGTLDERFVLTQILVQPEEIFLLHGRTWKVVEHREGELLVETVNELGVEPRWVGEDLPVPFGVAQEIGRLRREGDLDRYPLENEAARRLRQRLATGASLDVAPTDRRITVTIHGRLAVIGACFGTLTNETLALLWSDALTERLGARVEVVEVEPTWILLNLPVAMTGDALRESLFVPSPEVDARLERVVPTGLEYRWVFLTVARKLGVIPESADPRDLRILEPLLDRSQKNPLGEESLDKTLEERYDAHHAREVLEALRNGLVEVRATAPNPFSDLPLARLRWRTVPDIPPPTLLKAVEERLRVEPLTLVCLRCGFHRTTTAAQYEAEGGSRCLVCHGSLSGVFSPRRVDEIDRVVRYARSKRHKEKSPSLRRHKDRKMERATSPEMVRLIRAAYTSAELLAQYGRRALYCLAARGIGPDTARRLLLRLYRDDRELVTEILRAERSYARTRAFWE